MTHHDVFCEIFLNFHKSIFITDPKTMSLEEAIYTTGNKKPLAQMNPPGIAANKVVAKTNAAGFDTYGPDGMSFVGWHYVDGKYLFIRRKAQWNQ